MDKKNRSVEAIKYWTLAMLLVLFLLITIPSLICLAWVHVSNKILGCFFIGLGLICLLLSFKYPSLVEKQFSPKYDIALYEGFGCVTMLYGIGFILAGILYFFIRSIWWLVLPLILYSIAAKFIYSNYVP